jgi:hypothetical protein
MPFLVAYHTGERRHTIYLLRILRHQEIPLSYEQAMDKMDESML